MSVQVKAKAATAERVLSGAGSSYAWSRMRAAKYWLSVSDLQTSQGVLKRVGGRRMSGELVPGVQRGRVLGDRRRSFSTATRRC